MIKELDSVVLTTDLPEHGLAKDDIGTVVLVHENGKGCTVEFMTLAGKTLAVVTPMENQVVNLAWRPTRTWRGRWRSTTNHAVRPAATSLPTRRL